jgi:cytochrome c oxidase assembly protein subunit 15
MTSAMTSSRLLRYLAWFAVVFAFTVVVFGAFVRLSNAGLSCPDWPTCYGQIAWPKHETEIAKANEAFPDRPVESNKAWREQGHRFLAGGLILTTFGLTAVCWHRRREVGGVTKVAFAACVMILFQALLGMWTVTWKLKPIVVMGHLLGGMTTFGLLAYIALRISVPALGAPDTVRLRRMLIAGIVLLALQIALGGWTSANYAALACGTDFPTCLGQWWPPTDFHEAFVLWRGIGVNYEGGVLDAAARTAIQLVHRLGAVVVFGHFLACGIIAWRRGLKFFGAPLIGALLIQISLGMFNVLLGLPLPVATAHNGGAAVLLLVALGLVVMLRDAALQAVPKHPLSH